MSSATRRITGSSVSTMTGARPMLSSSTSSTFGSCISARPMASICCSPPERLPAATFTRRLRSGKYSKIVSIVGGDRAATPA